MHSAAVIVPTIVFTPWAIHWLGLFPGIFWQINLLWMAWVYTAMATKPEDTASSTQVGRDHLKVACGFAVLGSATILINDAAHGVELQSSFPVAIANAVYVLLMFNGTNVRYSLSRLCCFGRLPVRLQPFLDWSVHARLLKHAGSAYQFRHRELQVWLATHSAPPASAVLEERRKGRDGTG